MDGHGYGSVGHTLGPVRVKLLNSFLVSIGPRIIAEDEWRLSKSAALVKLLALSPGHRLHREQVIDVLWPRLKPRAAYNNMRQALYSARQTFGPDPNYATRYLSLRKEQLALCPEVELWVDTETFERASAAARRARDPAAYRSAIDLYAGDLLPEDRYEPWVEDRRAELRGLHLALLVELAWLCEQRGDFSSAIEVFQRVVREEPTHEEAHAGLMRAYAYSGQRYMALAQYERLRSVLSRELGTEPDATIQELHREIVDGRFSPIRSSVAPRSTAEAERRSFGNLPGSVTSFVGREHESIEVKRLLAMTRMLTLTGTGGCGKTRLALEVARDLSSLYPDGAWLVNLGDLSDGESVPQVVATTLGVREHSTQPLATTLVDALRKQEVLFGNGRLRAPGGCLRAADGGDPRCLCGSTSSGHKPGGSGRCRRDEVGRAPPFRTRSTASDSFGGLEGVRIGAAVLGTCEVSLTYLRSYTAERPGRRAGMQSVGRPSSRLRAGRRPDRGTRGGGYRREARKLFGAINIG